MSVRENLKGIAGELRQNADGIDDEDFEKLFAALEASEHIFVSGKGRSLMAMSAFANRLVHLGYPVSMVGEISAPRASEKDLLLIGSSSGETAALVSLAQLAHKAGTKIALLTMAKSSSIAKLADVVVAVPGANKNQIGASIQPMGSSFEQVLWLTLDAFVLDAMRKRKMRAQDMAARHANLE